MLAVVVKKAVQAALVQGGGVERVKSLYLLMVGVC